jgi:DNA-binding response OmpR family regulator
MLLSDVDLPGLSGVELARWAGSIQPIVPALLMSTAGKDYLVDRGVLSPDSELLSKPFTLSTLLAKIEQVLEPTEGRPECNAARTGRDRARE